MSKIPTSIVINPDDNVAIALTDIRPKTKVAIEVGKKKYIIEVKERISFGHKFAIKDIKNGEAILKYGQEIGKATSDVKKGEYLHIHNIEGKWGIIESIRRKMKK